MNNSARVMANSHFSEVASASNAQQADQTQEYNMILIMGVTGSGKSHLINKLAGKTMTEESALLNSCTSTCIMVPTEIGGKKVLLIDTPGFDDTKRSDSEILTTITEMLVAQYKLGVRLKGAIYLHRVSDERYSGSAIKTLTIFQKICGPEALKNVILATTRWDKVDEDLGSARETQLRTEFWQYMISKGSFMTRFYGDGDSALAIASQLLGKSDIVLDIQHEVVDESKLLHQTSAGTVVSDGLALVKAKYEQELRDLEELKQTLQEDDRLLKKQLQRDSEKLEKEKRKSEQDALEDQKRLAANINQDVEQKLSARRRSKFFHGAGVALRFAPALIDLIGMFVGIPPGCTTLLASWASSSGITDSMANFFDDL